MKNKYTKYDVIGYIILSFVCCVVVAVGSYTYFASLNFEDLGIILEIPTACAFVIGAVYLFGRNQTCEDSAELPEHKEDDEADK